MLLHPALPMSDRLTGGGGTQPHPSVGKGMKIVQIHFDISGYTLSIINPLIYMHVHIAGTNRVRTRQHSSVLQTGICM
jgi:hypothetical protein